MTSSTVVCSEAPVVRPEWQQDFETGDETAIRVFATAIGDFNPIHHDHEAAITAGYDGIVAPGVKTMGIISATIAEEIPNVVLLELNVAFKKLLYAGSLPTVTCKVTGGRVTKSGRHIVNGVTMVWNGAELIAEGAFTLMLPK